MYPLQNSGAAYVMVLRGAFKQGLGFMNGLRCLTREFVLSCFPYPLSAIWDHNSSLIFQDAALTRHHPAELLEINFYSL
jgi:hypothetical protein